MIRNYLILIAFVAVGMFACKDDPYGPTLVAGAAPSITAPAAGSAFVLKEADKDKPFGDFKWTAADFGYQAGISYKLEMDLAGNNFQSPTEIGTISKLEITGKTIADINSALIAKGLPGDQEVSIELRVKATVSSEVDPLVSAPVAIKVTPYEAFIPTEYLQVPGDYQGWDPAKTTTVIFSTKADKKFEGYIYFPNADTKYKYTLGPSWTTNWGDNGNNGSLEKDGTDIPVSGAGLWKLNVNLNELTHTNQLTNWGLVGSATGSWDVDKDMTYNVATGELEITTDLVAGEIKFRANDDWAVNFGDNGANKSVEYGGDNIKVAEAGNYTVKLILKDPKYTYTITKN